METTSVLSHDHRTAKRRRPDIEIRFLPEGPEVVDTGGNVIDRDLLRHGVRINEFNVLLRSHAGGREVQLAWEGSQHGAVFLRRIDRRRYCLSDCLDSANATRERLNPRGILDALYLGYFSPHSLVFRDSIRLLRGPTYAIREDLGETAWRREARSATFAWLGNRYREDVQRRNFAAENFRTASRGQIIEELSRLTRQHLASCAESGDDPAIMLSSGLDSTFLAKQIHVAGLSRRYTAYCMSSSYMGTDETPRVERLAKRFGIEARFLSVGRNDLLDAARRFSRMDCISFDTGLPGTLILALATRHHRTVVVGEEAFPYPTMSFFSSRKYRLMGPVALVLNAVLENNLAEARRLLHGGAFRNPARCLYYRNKVHGYGVAPPGRVEVSLVDEFFGYFAGEDGTRAAYLLGSVFRLELFLLEKFRQLSRITAHHYCFPYLDPAVAELALLYPGEVDDPIFLGKRILSSCLAQEISDGVVAPRKVAMSVRIDALFRLLVEEKLIDPNRIQNAYAHITGTWHDLDSILAAKPPRGGGQSPGKLLYNLALLDLWNGAAFDSIFDVDGLPGAGSPVPPL